MILFVYDIYLLIVINEIIKVADIKKFDIKKSDIKKSDIKKIDIVKNNSSTLSEQEKYFTGLINN